MKDTGVIRSIDELGRLVVPKEIRKNLDIKPKDPIEIYVEDGRIILTKIGCSCIFCKSEEKLLQYGEKLVCKNCIENLKNL